MQETQHNSHLAVCDSILKQFSHSDIRQPAGIICRENVFLIMIFQGCVTNSLKTLAAGEC